jgi:hypothetical protein
MHFFPLGGIETNLVGHGQWWNPLPVNGNPQRIRVQSSNPRPRRHHRHDQPFCVIGRHQPTGRKILAAELEQGDYSQVKG